MYEGTGNGIFAFLAGDSPASVGGATIETHPGGGTNVIALHGITQSSVALWDDNSGRLSIEYTPNDVITVAGGSYSPVSGFSVGNIQEITFDSGNPILLTGGLNLTAVNFGQTIFGTVGGGDTLTAAGQADSLVAYAGNETLVAGVRATLFNGTGNDTDVFSLGAAPVSQGDDVIHANAAGGTNNTILVHGVSPSAVTLWDDSSGRLFVDYSASDEIAVYGGTYSPSAGFAMGNIQQIAFDSGAPINLTGGLNLTAAGFGQTIYGTVNGGDTLTAAGAADSLVAYGGNETLVAGVRATLFNGTGNDTDVFSLGAAPVSQGDDVIHANAAGGTNNTILIHGVSPSAVTLWDDSSGRLFVDYSASDEIAVYGGTYSSSAGFAMGNIQQIAFDSGTPINLTGGLNLTAASFGQTIYGTVNGGDTLTAAGAADSLVAYGGNETLVAGVRATLFNGTGNDTDVFSLGAAPVSQGDDVIHANSAGGTNNTILIHGVSPSAVTLWDDSSGRLFVDYSASDEIAVYGGSFNGTTGVFTMGNVQHIAFDSGAPISLTGGLTLTASSFGQTIYGTGFGDTLIARNTSDTLDEYAGNNTLVAGPSSTLNGGTGDDIYVINPGNGTVTVHDAGGTDQIQFGAGFSAANLVESRSGNNLNLTFNGDSADAVSIVGQYVTQNAIESIKFSDGTVVSLLPAPVAEPGNYSVNENAVLTGNVISNNGNPDTDPSGLALSVQAGTFTTAHGGSIVLSANGNFSYTPASGYYGPDSFNYVLQDTSGATANGNVSISIVPTPPVVEPGSFSGNENVALTGNVISNNGNPDTDPNGLALSVVAGTFATAHGGSVTLTSNGNFTYTPATGFYGSDSFTYTLQDTAGATANGSVAIGVAPTPPVAQPGSFSVIENAAVSGNVITNNGNPDTDPNGLALSVVAGTFATAHGGSVTLSANGNFTYAPAHGFYGSDSFSYTLQDTAGAMSTGNVTVGVVPTPPVAQPGSFSGNENIAVTGNVITNNGNPDTDPNGLVLSVVAGTFATAHGGSVTFSANGNFTYTPATGFYGSDSFSYTLQDTAGATATGNVSIGVAPTPPVAQPGSFSGQENMALTGNVITNNGNPDTDPNGLALSVTAGTFATAHGGSVTLASNGNFTYTPASGFYGSDSFNYTLQDTAGATSAGNVTLGIAPTPPVAQPGSYSGTENTALTGNVITNNGNPDTDPNGLALSVVAGTFATAHGGSVTLASNGNFTYTPAMGFAGSDSFTYTLQDTAGATAAGNVSVNVASTLSPPVTEPGNYSGNENFSVTGNVITNNGNPDTDPNGLALSVVAGTFATAHGGTVTFASNGNFTYTPAAGFYGADTFNYTLQDTGGETATGNVTVTLAPTPPVTQPGSFSGNENIALTGNVITNNGNPDTDPNGLALSVVAGTFATAHGGSVTLAGNGNFTYTPATGFYGSDSFTYTLQDTAGATATGNVTVGVAPAPPVAQPGSFSVHENAVLTGNVITNNGNPDTDPNSLMLSVQAGTFMTSHGTLTLHMNGDFTYTPNNGYFGSDSFTYTLQDTAGAQSTGNVAINVTQLLPPVAQPGNFSAGNTASASGNVISNNGNPDTDPNGLALSVVPESVSTAHGTVTVSANGNFTYTAQHGYIGSDSFNYTLDDSAGLTAIGSVNIANIFADTAPTAENDTFNANWAAAATAFSGNLMADNGNGPAIDIYGDPLHIVGTSATTANGHTVTLQSNGSFSVTEPEWFVGTDSFSYTISDPYGLTSTAVATLHVNAPAGSIVGTNGNDTLTATTAHQFMFGLLGNDIYHDLGTTAAVTMVGGPGNNTYYVNNAGDTIIQDPSGTGSIISSVSYTLPANVTNISVTDGVAVTIHANNLNDIITTNTGQDTIVGGTGTDTIYVNNTHDVINTAAGGTYNVFSSVSYTLTGGVQSLTLTGSSALTGTCDGGTETINANNAGDKLIGGTGTDFLNGGTGNDNITCGSGTQYVYGGGGTDNVTAGTGTGIDTFIFKAATAYTGLETINSYATQDRIELADLLQGFNPITSDIGQFVQIKQMGTSDFLGVDAQGPANPNHFIEIAKFAHVTGLDVHVMYAQGHLLVG
jgi:hypothetical protein